METTEITMKEARALMGRENYPAENPKHWWEARDIEDVKLGIEMITTYFRDPENRIYGFQWVQSPTDTTIVTTEGFEVYPGDESTLDKKVPVKEYVQATKTVTYYRLKGAK